MLDMLLRKQEKGAALKRRWCRLLSLCVVLPSLLPILGVLAASRASPQPVGRPCIASMFAGEAGLQPVRPQLGWPDGSPGAGDSGNRTASADELQPTGVQGIFSDGTSLTAGAGMAQLILSHPQRPVERIVPATRHTQAPGGWIAYLVWDRIITSGWCTPTTEVSGN